MSTSLQNQKSYSFKGYRNYQYENYNEDGTQKASWQSEEDWKATVAQDFQKIVSKRKIKYLAFIFHDRDRNKKGEQKGLHCHFALKTSDAAKFSTINKSSGTQLVTSSKQKHFEIMKSEGSSIRYLLHQTEAAQKAKKYPYSLPDLVVYQNAPEGSSEPHRRLPMDELADWYAEIASKDLELKKATKKNGGQAEFIKELQLKLRNGEIALQGDSDTELEGAELALRREFDDVEGYDLFQSNRERLKRCSEDYLNQKLEKRTLNRKPLKSVFFSGGSNLGKTKFMKDFAQYVAQQENDDSIHHAPSSADNKTYDFAQNYNAELQTIFDDLKPTAFGYDEFKNIFTRDAESPWATVRGKNKKWSADYAYITSDFEKELFVRKLSKRRLDEAEVDYPDKIKRAQVQQNILNQIYTRITLFFELTETSYSIYEYDIEKSRQTNQSEFAQLTSDSFEKLENFYDAAYREEIFKTLYNKLKESENSRI